MPTPSEKLTLKLRLPIIQAPMFLISGPEMVIAACLSGVVGSFPTPNARTLEQLEEWLSAISSELEKSAQEKSDSLVAPWAVNLITHRSYPRWQDDLDLIVKYRAPIVISALGSPKAAVEKIHSYGGKIYADVNSVAFARKAATTGVDGLALVCAGAGGHTGQLSPFAFIEEVRQFWQGEIILSGAISTGRGVAAAIIMGADYVYMGTRFIATAESLASAEYQSMVINSSAEDIVCSDSVTGVKANWIRNSLISAGYDPLNMPPASEVDFAKAAGDPKRWRDIWAAGQGLGSVDKTQSIAQLVSQIEREYRQAT